MQDQGEESTEERRSRHNLVSQLTPLLIGNGSEDDPSCWTVPDLPSWKDTIIFRSLGGHPILHTGE